MKDIFKFKVLVLLMASLCQQSLGQPLPGASGSGMEPKEAEAYNKQVQFLMQEVGIPGLSVAVIDGNEIVYSGAFGYKDWAKKPEGQVNTETAFEACSLSKSFLVYAVYSLIDQGVIDMDKPLHEYLQYEPLAHDDRYKLITARMVLGHSSGIENHMGYNNSEILEILADPGTEFTYSGEGYKLLSKVVEKLIGKSVEEYMQEMVYEPLDIKRTYTTTDEKKFENYAIGHSAFGDPLPKEMVLEPFIAARIHTTASDYARLMLGLFSGQYLSEQSFSELLKPEVRTRDNAEVYYGPGFELFFTPKGDTILIQGGDNAGFKGLACYSLKKKRGFVYFGNANRADQIGKAMCSLLLDVDLGPYYNTPYHNPYPTTANALFKVYKESGVSPMKEQLVKKLNLDAESFTESDMIEMVYYFKKRESETARFIADKYFEKNPDSTADFVYNRWLGGK